MRIPTFLLVPVHVLACVAEASDGDSDPLGISSFYSSPVVFDFSDSETLKPIFETGLVPQFVSPDGRSSLIMRNIAASIIIEGFILPETNYDTIDIEVNGDGRLSKFSGFVRQLPHELAREHAFRFCAALGLSEESLSKALSNAIYPDRKAREGYSDSIVRDHLRFGFSTSPLAPDPRNRRGNFSFSIEWSRRGREYVPPLEPVKPPPGYEDVELSYLSSGDLEKIRFEEKLKSYARKLQRAIASGEASPTEAQGLLKSYSATLGGTDVKQERSENSEVTEITENTSSDKNRPETSSTLFLSLIAAFFVGGLVFFMQKINGNRK